MPYRIERSLKRAEREVGKPLCAKYQVLKDRLFTQEYDEDFRRADPELQRRLNVPEESRFFWEFCQHISGIKPDLTTHRH